MNREPFDAAAGDYDATFTDLALGRELRSRAWHWLDRAFAPSDRVLEIGCGTGEDAVHLAGRGVLVVATDASAAMVEQARAKVVERGADDMVELLVVAAQALSSVGWEDGSFDGAFGDFGAINVVPDRRRLAVELARLVRQGGRVVLVVMGPVSVWEIAWHTLHGEPDTALRRMRSGAEARLPGGGAVPVWYPSPRTLERELAPRFVLTDLGALGVALPPTELAQPMERRPGLLRRLAAVDRVASALPGAAWLADHYVATFERA